MELIRVSEILPVVSNVALSTWLLRLAMKKVIGISVAILSLGSVAFAQQGKVSPKQHAGVDPLQPVPAHSAPVAPAIGQPAGGTPSRFSNTIYTYKIKLSEGTAWTNLQPESWLVFDVSNGNTIVIRHSTNVLNMITSISRWWDHPIIESRACRVTIGETGKRLTGCLSGITSGTGKAQRHVLILPVGDTIHDYMFEVKWQENGLTHEAMTRVAPGTKPTAIQAMP